MLTEEERVQNNLEMDDNGWCTKLKQDNTCSIYDERPEVCRINHKKWNLEKDIYYSYVAKICNSWMDEDGVLSKRVEL